MAVPGQRPGLGPGTQAISQIPLVIPLGLGYGSIHCYRAPWSGAAVVESGSMVASTGVS